LPGHSKGYFSYLLLRHRRSCEGTQRLKRDEGGTSRGLEWFETDLLTKELGPRSMEELRGKFLHGGGKEARLGTIYPYEEENWWVVSETDENCRGPGTEVSETDSKLSFLTVPKIALQGSRVVVGGVDYS